MPEVLKRFLFDESMRFQWLEHDSDFKMGPFVFPADLPIPIAPAENMLAHANWLQVPYTERGALPTGPESDEDGVNGEELFRAVLEGHLSLSAPDGQALVDHVGRCLLMIALLETEDTRHSAVVNLVGHTEEGEVFFDNLLRLGKQFIDDGLAFSEQGKQEDSLTYMIIALALLKGAHLISPTTTGVTYNLALIYYDLAKRFSLPDEGKDSEWKRGLVFESSSYLQLSLADEAIRKETPAFFLLGVCRKTLEDSDGAHSAFSHFLESEAAEKFKTMADEARAFLSEGGVAG